MRMRTSSLVILRPAGGEVDGSCAVGSVMYGLSSRGRRDAVARHQEGLGCERVGRRAMVDAQSAFDPLFHALAIGINDQGVAIRDTRPEWAAERAGKQAE